MPVPPGAYPVAKGGDGVRRELTWGRAALYMALVAGLAVLLAERTAVAEAVRAGLAACAVSVVPALFPCFAAVSLAVDCGAGELLPPAVSAFVVGAVGGYPTGARTVGQLYESGALTKAEAARLLCCCNNAGPAFVLGIAGSMFSPPGAAFLLWFVHLLPPLVHFLIIFRRFAPQRRALPPLPDLPTAFVRAVAGAAESMVGICGFVVFFSIIVRMLTPLVIHPQALGILELTWGVLAISDSPVGFVWCAFLLGWGGFSVHCQTAAVVADTDLPVGKYLLWKALHGLFSAVAAAGAARFLWNF